jgi:hypothetical protein
MDERNPDGGPDDALKKVLEAWTIGSPSGALEARLRQSFRRAGEKGLGPWPRWLGASVRVPLPVLVGLVVACLASAAFAIRSRAPLALPTAEKPLPQTTRGPHPLSVSLVGFEPVPEPKLTVLLRRDER